MDGYVYTAHYETQEIFAVQVEFISISFMPFQSHRIAIGDFLMTTPLMIAAFLCFSPRIPRRKMFLSYALSLHPCLHIRDARFASFRLSSLSFSPSASVLFSLSSLPVPFLPLPIPSHADSLTMTNDGSAIGTTRDQTNTQIKGRPSKTSAHQRPHLHQVAKYNEKTEPVITEL